ncbi:hypothetical protein BDB01DRAFT_801633 [Pilobolus umbonatus]|nr:hypothetical protein BDB01DRAFT_801633 [Pilobolus umbonatus]
MLKGPLAELVEKTRSISSIPIQYTPNALVSNKRKYIRHATQQEKKLAQFYSGESITKKIKTYFEACQLDGPPKQKIERILRTVNSLNQIGNRPDIKTQVEDYAQLLEEYQFKIEYLDQEYTKLDAEIEELSILEDAVLVNTGEEEALMKEIEREEAMIRELERELRQKSTKTEKIKERREEQERLNERMVMSLSNMNNDKNKNELEIIQEELQKKQHKIEEYDIVLEDMDDQLNRRTPYPLFNQLKSQCELVLTDHSNHSDSLLKELLSLLDTIETHLNEIILSNEPATNETMVAMTQNLLSRLFSFIQDDGRHLITQEHINILTPLFPNMKSFDIHLSSLTQLKSRILHKLVTEKTIRLKELTDYVDSLRHPDHPPTPSLMYPLLVSELVERI